MSDITIHLARPKNARRIAAMSRDLIETGLGWGWRPRRVARRIRDPDTCAVIAVRERTLVGFAIMKFADATGHLMLLAVSPDVRRSGVGKAMLAWLETSARVAGLSRIKLQVRAKNSGAQAFYKALGYQATATVPKYYRGREDAVEMEHVLLPASNP